MLSMKSTTNLLSIYRVYVCDKYLSTQLVLRKMRFKMSNVNGLQYSKSFLNDIQVSEGLQSQQTTFVLWK